MFAESKKPLIIIIDNNLADLITDIQSLSSRKRIKNTVLTLRRQQNNDVLEEIKRSRSEEKWLICNCIHVDAGLVHKILNELRKYPQNINKNFRIWICSLRDEYEEQPMLPTPLLLHSEKYLREGAKGFEGQLKTIFESHHIRDAYEHIDNLQWKKVIYSVSLFHSIILNQVVTSGLHDRTKFVNIDRKTLKYTFKILEAIVEKVTTKTVNFDGRYLSHIVAEVIYGGFAQNIEVLNDFIKLGNMLFIDQRTEGCNDILLPLTTINRNVKKADFFSTYAIMEKSISEIDAQSYIDLIDEVAANLSKEAFSRQKK